ncbi:MAG: ribonuclease III [Myxococcota bacterium]
MSEDASSRFSTLLGYTFDDEALLVQALTHRSFVNESKTERLDNERFEFLGDAVLDLAVSEALMSRFPDADEGTLSRMRAFMVSEVGLARVADRLALGDALYLGRGEEQSGGRQKASLLADAFEAVVAAMYLDGGLEPVRRLVSDQFELPEEHDVLGDAKSALQQRLQARQQRAPRYRLIREEGPDHDKAFTVEVWLDDQRLGTGWGRSKKEAEQRAAASALVEMTSRASP